jgi:hypothetical protein
VDALTDAKAIGLCFLFVLADLDTVTGSLGLGMERLAKSPRQRRELWPAVLLKPGLQPCHEGGASGAVVRFDALLDCLGDGAAGLAVGAERGRADAEHPGTGALVGGERGGGLLTGADHDSPPGDHVRPAAATRPTVILRNHVHDGVNQSGVLDQAGLVEHHGQAANQVEP